MNTLNQRIQIEVLGRLGQNPRGDVLRMDIAKQFNVPAKRVDDAMALCALVRRVTANNGSFVRYRFV